MKLIVGNHAVDKARERIFSSKYLSEKTIRRWYQENVPFAEKIPWGSELYFRLEKGKKEHDRKFFYFKDDFGIYVVEVINNKRGFLRTVRELKDFGEYSKVKLAEFINKEKLADLVKLRNTLGRNQKISKEIENLIA